MAKEESDKRPVGRPARLQMELIEGQLHIVVAEGEPVVLQGFHVEKKEWQDVVVISSHGGKCKVPEGRYSEFRFDKDTNKRMTFEPPKVTPIGKSKRKAQIIKNKPSKE